MSVLAAVGGGDLTSCSTEATLRAEYACYARFLGMRIGEVVVKNTNTTAAFAASSGGMCPQQRTAAGFSGCGAVDAPRDDFPTFGFASSSFSSQSPTTSSNTASSATVAPPLPAPYGSTTAPTLQPSTAQMIANQNSRQERDEMCSSSAPSPTPASKADALFASLPLPLVKLVVDDIKLKLFRAYGEGADEYLMKYGALPPLLASAVQTAPHMPMAASTTTAAIRAISPALTGTKRSRCHDGGPLSSAATALTAATTTTSFDVSVRTDEMLSPNSTIKKMLQKQEDAKRQIVSRLSGGSSANSFSARNSSSSTRAKKRPPRTEKGETSSSGTRIDNNNNNGIMRGGEEEGDTNEEADEEEEDFTSDVEGGGDVFAGDGYGAEVFSASHPCTSLYTSNVYAGGAASIPLSRSILTTTTPTNATSALAVGANPDFPHHVFSAGILTREEVCRIINMPLPEPAVVSTQLQAQVVSTAASTPIPTTTRLVMPLTSAAAAYAASSANGLNGGGGGGLLLRSLAHASTTLPFCGGLAHQRQRSNTNGNKNGKNASATPSRSGFDDDYGGCFDSSSDGFGSRKNLLVRLPATEVDRLLFLKEQEELLNNAIEKQKQKASTTEREVFLLKDKCERMTKVWREEMGKEESTQRSYDMQILEARRKIDKLRLELKRSEMEEERLSKIIRTTATTSKV